MPDPLSTKSRLDNKTDGIIVDRPTRTLCDHVDIIVSEDEMLLAEGPGDPRKDATVPSGPKPGHRPYERTRPPSPDALGRDEAAAFLGVSKGTLFRWTRAGRLATFTFAGASWWLRHDLQAVLDDARSEVTRG